MKDSMTVDSAAAWPIGEAGFLDRLARRTTRRSLARLEGGYLTLIEGGERTVYGDPAADLRTTVRVHHPGTYRRLLFGGTVGAGEAYMDGLWSCDDLPTLIRILAADQRTQLGLEGGLARLSRPLNALGHFLRKNTRPGSRRNISEHYDLGNEFYRLFLDETMTYSCGVFETRESSLAEASRAKYDRLCRKLGLTSRDHVLEIGTGWGGFAIHAARHYGCTVTTTTISREQRDLALERVSKAGLSDRVTILLQDYRDLAGRFDKLVSIEMIEAVGHHYLDTFFRRCSELLRPDGVMALQAITMSDQDYDRHKSEVDFIKKHIFPGSCIPSITAMLSSLTRATDLRLRALEEITEHYVSTLRHWRSAFLSRLADVRRLGFSDRFIRMWDYYLGYCEGGFAERYLGNVQMVLVKPAWRPPV